MNTWNVFVSKERIGVGTKNQAGDLLTTDTTPLKLLVQEAEKRGLFPLEWFFIHDIQGQCIYAVECMETTTYKTLYLVIWRMS